MKKEKKLQNRTAKNISSYKKQLWTLVNTESYVDSNSGIPFTD